MSLQLLTYQEFQKIVDFQDNVNDSRFNKYEKISEETYIRELIGSDLIDSVKAGTYPELLPYIKNCLAHEIELYFIETGNVITTGLGSVQRDSTYSKDPSWLAHEKKVDAVKTILRRYETVLRTFLAAGTYTDYNSETSITKKVNFSITSVGD